jgi:hypothetical protein
LSFLALYFFTYNHMVYLQRSNNAVRKCVGTPKEFYYEKLPAKECVLNRADSQCSIVPLSNADSLEEANKDIKMCSGTIDFVHDTTKEKDCERATAICLDASKVTSPPSATTKDADGVEKVLWCAECTSGPDWSLQDSSLPFNVGIVTNETTGVETPKWAGFSSSANADQNNPCVWVDEPLPIIDQKGYGTTTAAAPAKSCINRFNFLDNHKCQADSYPEFLFEYGHPEKCAFSLAGRGNIFGSQMYPDCVTPNYEKVR